MSYRVLAASYNVILLNKQKHALNQVWRAYSYALKLSKDNLLA